mmetsp:Transcript_25710/g.39455  ORF Transcript_25710/g.39455 Transcript_25710/m.39455 type:complete len:95 (-) Transcript_25710:232-516(-)
MEATMLIITTMVIIIIITEVIIIMIISIIISLPILEEKPDLLNAQRNGKNHGKNLALENANLLVKNTNLKFVDILVNLAVALLASSVLVQKKVL